MRRSFAAGARRAEPGVLTGIDRGAPQKQGARSELDGQHECQSESNKLPVIPDAALPTLGVNAKLNRGRELLEQLIAEGKSFVDSDAFEIVPSHNDELTVYEFRVKLLRPPDVVRWAVLIGDAVNNIRSVLDHAVYAVAVHASGQEPPPRHTSLQFPIADTANEFSGSARRRLHGLPSDAVKTIEVAQPYHGDPALARLRDLSSTDKHRLLHLIAGMPETSTIDVRNASDLVEAVINTGEPVVNGTVLAKFAFAAPCVPTFSPRVSILYSFPDERRPWKGATRELAGTWHRVVDVVNKLRPFMPPL